MLKLYKITETEKLYWETWDNDDGTHTVHWGKLGSNGNTKTVKSSLFQKATKTIQKEIDVVVSDGYAPIDIDDHYTLLVEYAVEGMGTEHDIDKRYRLQDRMDQTLGWTGLGACDGGSIGSGSMEVCNYVVDFQLAKQVIEDDLQNTEFSNYSRIYDENAPDA